MDKPKPKSKRKRHPCQICDKVLCRKERMVQHMWTAHKVHYVSPQKPKGTAENPRPFICETCGSAYIQKKGLRRHMREKHIGHKCKECGEMVFEIDRHLQEVHNTERPRPFECDKCKKCFLSVGNLKMHQVNNCGIKSSFECRKCDEVFEDEALYRKHERWHIYERRKMQKAMCDICGKVVVKAGLESHTKSHSDEKLFKCHYCGDRFKTLSVRTLHERKHTNERPFACKLCDKSFMDRSCLRVHMRCHTGESPYLCHLCGRRTKQAQNLASHYRHFHRNNEVSSKMIRYNAKVFARYSQEQIDATLGSDGDLSALLAKGIIEYNREMEQKEQEQKEKALKLLQKPSYEVLGSSKKEVKAAPEETSFACDLCGKEFAEQSYFKAHLRYHNRNNSYFCHLCGHRETDEASLASHYSIFHPKYRATARVIRSNAKVFANYSEEEIQSALEANGNLSALLSTGASSSEAATKCEPNFHEFDNESETATYLLEDDGAFDEMEIDLSTIKDEDVAIYEDENVDRKDGFGQIFHIEIKSEAPEIIDESSFQDMNAVFFPETEDAEDNGREREETGEGAKDFEMNEVGFSDDSWSWSEKSFDEKPPAKSKSKKTVKKESNEEADSKEVCVEETYCGICDKIFSRNDIWLAHMTKCHNELKVRKRSDDTAACEEKRQRRKQEKRAKLPKMRCPYDDCNAFYSVDHMLKKHKESDRPFECYLCRQSFAKQSNLRGHMNTLHVKAKREGICHVCGHISKSPRAMRSHIYNKHTFPEPFPCEVCHDKFPTPSALKKHMINHSDERKYICPFCNAGFVTASGLKIHKRLHTGEKPFECKFCGNRFSDNSTRVQHQRLHTGERPYMCHLCDRRTVQPGNLKSHYRHFHKVIVKHVKMNQMITDDAIVQVLPGYSLQNG